MKRANSKNAGNEDVKQPYISREAPQHGRGRPRNRLRPKTPPRRHETVGNPVAQPRSFENRCFQSFNAYRVALLASATEESEEIRHLQKAAEGLSTRSKRILQILHGLHKFGKGDWKNISKYSVRTRSSSQVASHVQKYFTRLSSTKKEGKRLSINAITTLKPEKLLVFEKETTSFMPECCKGESSTAGTGELLSGNLERAAAHAGTQLLSGCAMLASGSAFGSVGDLRKLRVLMKTSWGKVSLEKESS